MADGKEMESDDQIRFVLPGGKWKAFLEATNLPPKTSAGLERLFSRPSIAESR
jgi:hypothetical protein